MTAAIRLGVAGTVDWRAVCCTATVDFDAILALNDTFALGALRVLGQHGIRVPDDVAVAGFDNIDEASYSTPSLTTVDPGRSHIARTAVELLVRRMAGDDSEHREIAAPYELSRVRL